MSKLLQRLKAQSTIAGTDVLADSVLYNAKDMVSTAVPMFNVAFSGKFSGGFCPGFTILAGPSKHFKTGFLLLQIKAYLDKYPDAVVIFYDSEFGSPQSYFQSFGIDPNRILHVPLMNMEQLKFDLMNYFDPKNKEGIKRGDRVFIAIDSLGNLASLKEVEDAQNEKSVSDMSRAKQAKSIFRMITPYLRTLDIPMTGIQHVYKEQTGSKYAKTIVAGGEGAYYSADTIFIIGRQQEAEGEGADKEVVGYNFILNVEKSRYVREKSKIPITISFNGGISKWSGLMENALESGHVIKPVKGWYSKVGPDGVIEDKKYRLADTENAEFWLPILTNKSYQDFIEAKYRLSDVAMLSDDDIAAIYAEAEEGEEA